MKNAGDIFERAVSQQKSGDLETAEKLYKQILHADPNHADALHMLGVIALQRKQYDVAIKLIIRAIRINPRGAGMYTNLGTAYLTLNQPDAAIDAFRKALSLKPLMALAHNNLANAYCKKGLQQQSIDSYKKAIEISPTFSDAYVNLGGLFLKQDDLEEARNCFQQALKYNPEHASARHMLASLTNAVTETAPPEHVRQLFDEYAPRFDAHLTGDLGYSMPDRMRDEILRIDGAHARFRNVIDLGCGTGLTGAAFRTVSQRITGVDLSSRMLEQAKDRKVYDALYNGDILSHLLSSDETYNLFICADVFPYIGNIYPLFEAVKTCAAEDAWFAFSTEATTGHDYVLRDTGRYAHSAEYIEEAARKIGFSLTTVHTENLRKHKGKWIVGDLIVLRSVG